MGVGLRSCWYTFSRYIQEYRNSCHKMGKLLPSTMKETDSRESSNVKHLIYSGGGLCKAGGPKFVSLLGGLEGWK